jgi:hypothetical protein
MMEKAVNQEVFSGIESDIAVVYLTRRSDGPCSRDLSGLRPPPDGQS